MRPCSRRRGAATASSRRRAGRPRNPRGWEYLPAWSNRGRDRAGISLLPASRCGLADRLFVEIFSHPRGDAGSGKLAQPDRMNAGILVLVIDLRPALLHRGIRRLLDLHLVGQHGIAMAAHRHRKVTGWLGPGVEMLMEHAVRRRKYETMPPFVALEIVVALVPHQRV